ncbi:MAG: outer membrane lipoprotein carrier protein LolA [Alphaproteobacteria bacterium]|nr:outer membrane lipoprotein carrier protein LolA [Alphaproteobacteria bacterium]
MKRFAAALAVLVPLALAVPAIAAEEGPATVEELVTEVEKAYDDVSSLKADFVLVTRSAAMGERKERGKVTLKRPKMMRWDSRTPNGQGSLFVTDGAKMWVYTPANAQVLVFNDVSNAGASAGLVDLLDNLGNMDEYFDASLMEPQSLQDKKSVGVVLKPKSESQFSEIRLVFSRKKYELEQVTTVDVLGAETEISFSQVRVNQEIADGEFSFTAPDGAEVINADGI